MIKPLAFACAAVVVLTLAACGDSGTSGTSEEAGREVGAAGPPTPATQRLAWGQPAEVLGYDQTKIRVTPTGLLYHKGPYNSGLDGPENGWYVAIAIKAEALGKPDTTAGGAGGGGFEWRGTGQTITAMDGSASGSPWVGAVAEFSVDSPIEPGDPRVGIETFDIPSKTGGRLVYLSPEDHTITATWDLPAADQGTGLELTKVRKRIKLFS